MKPELIIAMDNGKRLVNRLEYDSEMYRDINDTENGPYVLTATSGTRLGRADKAFDWDGWEIKEEPQTRPSTRMEPPRRGRTRDEREKCTSSQCTERVNDEL